MAKKLYYTFGSEEFNGNREFLIDKYLENGKLSSSCWFTSLKSNTSEFLVGKYIPSIIKFIQYLQTKCIENTDSKYCEYLNWHYATAKTCPGVRGFLQNSIIVKSPADIMITINSDGSWVYKSAESSLIKITDDHPSIQYGYPFEERGSELFKHKAALKLTMPIFIGTNSISYSILDPQYHNKRIPFTVAQGEISGRSTKVTPLNVIALVDIPEEGSETYYIKEGDVLAYIWASSTLKLEYNNALSPYSSNFRTKFLNSYGGANGN